MTLWKPYLVCTCYDKWIYAKKCEWRFGSVRILLVGECIYIEFCILQVGSFIYI